MSVRTLTRTILFAGCVALLGLAFACRDGLDRINLPADGPTAPVTEDESHERIAVGTGRSVDPPPPVVSLPGNQTHEFMSAEWQIRFSYPAELEVLPYATSGLFIGPFSLSITVPVSFLDDPVCPIATLPASLSGAEHCIAQRVERVGVFEQLFTVRCAPEGGSYAVTYEFCHNGQRFSFFYDVPIPLHSSASSSLEVIRSIVGGQHLTAQVDTDLSILKEIVSSVRPVDE